MLGQFGWEAFNVEVLKDLIVGCESDGDTGGHYLEESAEGMGPGDGDEA